MTVHVATPLRSAEVAAFPAGSLRQADFAARADAAAEVAARHAAAVDTQARFPTEAVVALRKARLLGMMVPVELGGEGATISETADVCHRLGRACSSTAMIFAMHQVKVACVVEHGRDSLWHEAVLGRLAGEQMLWASSTTEGAGGGDVRSSEAAIDVADGRVTLDRAATVISYGAQADAIVTTARRAADAAASDQVLVVLLKADYRLEPISAWETLGMRGTRSEGFRLVADAPADSVLPKSYEPIHAQTMTPTAHLLWAAVWTGIAAEAVERARLHTRKALRKAEGRLPPSMPHVLEAGATLRRLRALLTASLARYEAAVGDPDALGAIDFQTAIHLLKVDASDMAVAIVLKALRAIGLSGYRTDTDVSVERQLRDVLSSPLMISNDRILASIGAQALLGETPASLFA